MVLTAVQLPFPVSLGKTGPFSIVDAPFPERASYTLAIDKILIHIYSFLKVSIPDGEADGQSEEETSCIEQDNPYRIILPVETQELPVEVVIGNIIQQACRSLTTRTEQQGEGDEEQAADNQEKYASKRGVGDVPSEFEHRENTCQHNEEDDLCNTLQLEAEDNQILNDMQAYLVDA